MSLSIQIISFKSLFKKYYKSIAASIQDGIIVSIGLVAARLCAFLVSVIIARSFGAESFGQYTLFVTIFILSSEIPNAFDVAYIRFANSKEGKGIEDEFLLMNLFAVSINALIIGTLGWVIAPFIAESFFNDGTSIDIIRYSILSGVIFCIFTCVIASYQQKRQFFQVSILRPLFNICLLCCIVVAVLLEVKVTQAGLSYLYLFLSMSFSILALYKFRDVIRNNIASIKNHFKPFFSVALLLILSSTINQLSARLDVFFIASFLNYEELGTYGAAVRVSIFISLFTAMLTTLLIPRAPVALNSTEELKRYYGLAGVYLFGQLCVAIVLMIWMSELITLVFGQEYIAARIAAIFLVMQAFFNSCCIPFQALIQCGKNPKVILIVNIAKMIVSVILLPFLIITYGLNGAALAVTIVSLITAILMAVVAVRYNPLNNRPVM